MWALDVFVPEWAPGATTLKIPYVPGPFSISQLPGLGPRQGPAALGLRMAKGSTCPVDGTWLTLCTPYTPTLALMAREGCLLKQHDFNVSRDLASPSATSTQLPPGPAAGSCVLGVEAPDDQEPH